MNVNDQRSFNANGYGVRHRLYTHAIFVYSIP